MFIYKMSKLQELNLTLWPAWTNAMLHMYTLLWTMPRWRRWANSKYVLPCKSNANVNKLHFNPPVWSELRRTIAACISRLNSFFYLCNYLHNMNQARQNHSIHPCLYVITSKTQQCFNSFVFKDEYLFEKLLVFSEEVPLKVTLRESWVIL